MSLQLLGHRSRHHLLPAGVDPGLQELLLPLQHLSQLDPVPLLRCGVLQPFDLHLHPVLARHLPSQHHLRHLPHLLQHLLLRYLLHRLRQQLLPLPQRLHQQRHPLPGQRLLRLGTDLLRLSATLRHLYGYCHQLHHLSVGVYLLPAQLLPDRLSGGVLPQQQHLLGLCQSVRHLRDWLQLLSDLHIQLLPSGVFLFLRDYLSQRYFSDGFFLFLVPVPLQHLFLGGGLSVLHHGSADRIAVLLLLPVGLLPQQQHLSAVRLSMLLVLSHQHQLHAMHQLSPAAGQHLHLELPRDLLPREPVQTVSPVRGAVPGVRQLYQLHGLQLLPDLLPVSLHQTRRVPQFVPRHLLPQQQQLSAVHEHLQQLQQRHRLSDLRWCSGPIVGAVSERLSVGDVLAGRDMHQLFAALRQLHRRPYLHQLPQQLPPGRGQFLHAGTPLSLGLLPAHQFRPLRQQMSCQLVQFNQRHLF